MQKLLFDVSYSLFSIWMVLWYSSHFSTLSYILEFSPKWTEYCFCFVLCLLPVYKFPDFLCVSWFFDNSVLNDLVFLEHSFDWWQLPQFNTVDVSVYVPSAPTSVIFQSRWNVEVSLPSVFFPSPAYACPQHLSIYLKMSDMATWFSSTALSSRQRKCFPSGQQWL